MRFDGKVALITGAGKGLGRAYAHWLAKRGATVVVNNRVHPGTVSSAQTVVDEITAFGGSASRDEHPVDDQSAAQAMVDEARERHGRLDILVCNAGISSDCPFTELSMEQFREIMGINFWGTVYPVQAALKGMLDSGYGRMVLSTSQAGLFGQGRGVAYSASKSALIGLARGIAKETGDANICINLLAPAAYTPMSSREIDARWSEFMSPFKVAPVVGWLCSESCRVNGAIFNAGAGRVRRARIMETRPVDLQGDEMNTYPPALDDLTDAIEATSSFDSGSVLMPELFEAFPEMVGKR